MKVFVIGTLIIFLMSASVDAAISNSSEWAIPKNLHVYNDDGQTYVDHVFGECTQKRYRLDPNHKKYDAILPILLAAQMGQRKILLRYDHSEECTQGRIIGVYID